MRIKKTGLAMQIALASALPLSAEIVSADDTNTCSGNAATSTLTCTGVLYYGNPNGYDNVVIETVRAGSTTGSNGLSGFGIYGNSSTYNLKNLQITTAGGQADAIQANNGTNKITIDSLTIVTKGSSADGINVTENAYNSVVTVGDNASITAEGTGMGVRANTSKNGGKNQIVLGKNAQITTTGSASNWLDGTGYAVYAGNRDLSNTTYKGDAEVTLGDGSVILTKGSAAHAVYANRGGVINLGDTSITTEKTNAYGIYAQTLSDANGARGSQVNLGGDTRVTVTDGNRALYTTGAGSSISSEQASVYHIDSSADSEKANRLGAVLLADNTAVIDLKMAAGSYFNGTTSTASGGVIDLAMDGDTSRWFMTGNSNLTNLSLTDGAQLIYDRHDEQGAYAYKTLTVDGNFSGGGHLTMNTYLDDDLSSTDKLAIGGDSSGTTRVTVNNTGGPGDQTFEGIQLITVAGTSAGEFNADRVTQGGYEYLLRRGGTFAGSEASDKDWYLTSYLPTDPEPEPEPEPEPQPEPGPGPDPTPDPDPIPAPEPGPTPTPPPPPSDKERIRQPEGGAYTANLAAANTLFLHRLHDRTGNLTYVDPDTGEAKTSMLWMRAVDGSGRWNDSTGQLKTETNRSVLQIGSDLKRWSNEHGDWVLGVMGGYANGNSTTRSRITGYQAKGDIDGYSLGLYGTWYENRADENGAYIDTWVLYNQFDNEVRGEQLAKEKYDSDGVTASIEAGKTFQVAKGESASLYVQPQAQVVYMGVKADSHREANGTRVTGKGDGNLMTRLGARAALRSNLEEGFAKTYAVEPYVETNWIHNSKDFGARMGSSSFEMDGAQDIFEVKVGATSKVNSRVNVWGEVGHQHGDNGYRDKAFTLGLKVNF
ncbi:autotransporter outer membrane beta-barrel domain-containing protein [Pseudomonas citronellolis]|uniref:autotransporter outer membrane beta-barrel domain-containing protein n=1 Tax=Pseudomonas citronellolis TaxID=53408 RepID=UPI0023E3ADAF|nr:autotransporter outer membrane beta-barrel domain-containing protein [Pseudomonas citronellolis]MDF3934597.1 autotransporter outer membrane beta-barrel domain-containing protein [Pseudomonas citronellolis]